jgi:hypothetical protein
MFIDVVQLKLEQLPTESDEGIPLATLGKDLNKNLFLLLLNYF